MTDDPTNKPPNGDKTPEAIKQHKQKQTFEYKGPGGSAMRQADANLMVEKDRERFSGNRAEKYANMEKAKIATTKDMEDGRRGLLSKEYSPAAKDKER
jgi:hypothetical protein